MPGPEPSDEDITFLRLMRLRREPFATARDIEPHVEVGYKQTRNRLDDLVDDGLLNVEKVGTVKVYWLSDAGKDRLAESDEF